MLLNVRSIAVSIAVVFFFGLSIIGLISGLSTFVCCKRAVAGAVLAYIGASLAVRAINTILFNAMINNQVNRRKDSMFPLSDFAGFEDKFGGRTN